MFQGGIFIAIRKGSSFIARIATPLFNGTVEHDRDFERKNINLLEFVPYENKNLIKRKT